MEMMTTGVGKMDMCFFPCM